MKVIRVWMIVVAALVVAGLGSVYWGAWNAAADVPHWGLTTRLLESVRDRSIAVRAEDIRAPDLDDANLIAVGAGHYAAMCTDCHLAPGMRDTELRAGLYPQAPNLAQRGPHRRPEQTFWIIKHGLKMTGMPAWGVTHDDDSLWGLVAFVRKLPDLSPEAYRDLVAQRGGGHSHGAGTHDSDDSVGGHSHDEPDTRNPQSLQDDGKGEAGAGHDHSAHPHDGA